MAGTGLENGSDSGIKIGEKEPLDFDHLCGNPYNNGNVVRVTELDHAYSPPDASDHCYPLRSKGRSELIRIGQTTVLFCSTTRPRRISGNGEAHRESASCKLETLVAALFRPMGCVRKTHRGGDRFGRTACYP